jgi:addiction module HigA family antidote
MANLSRIKTHPGDILYYEYLDANPDKVTAFEEKLVLQYPLIELINGVQHITYDVAVQLSKQLGTTVEFWTNLQYEYDRSLYDAITDT